MGIILCWFRSSYRQAVKVSLFYFICILAEIYNKIEILLFIEALGDTEEISLDWFGSTFFLTSATIF